MTSNKKITASSNTQNAATSSTTLNGIGTAPNSSNITWTTGTTINTPYTTTAINWDDFYRVSEGLAESIILYYTEEELRDLLAKLKGKNIKTELFNTTIKEIIAKRHCSEQFILDYLDLDPSKINREIRLLLLKQHSSDILSGTYSQLALLLELTKEN